MRVGIILAVFPWVLAAAAILAAAWLWRDRKHLSERLVEAEIRRLRTQLNPHFLYNTLNAISELGYNDPKTADEVVTQLSQLLRKSMDDSHQHEIALRDEITFLERYLAIQKILLRDRLEATLDIDADTLCARLPGMIVQPLAENALTHGIGADGIARVRIRATHEGVSLIIQVEDDGPGLQMKEETVERGIGLANIRARLHHLYGDAAQLALQPRTGGGLMARLVIPFHEGFAYSETPRSDHR